MTSGVTMCHILGKWDWLTNLSVDSRSFAVDCEQFLHCFYCHPSNLAAELPPSSAIGSSLLSGTKLVDDLQSRNEQISLWFR